MGSRPGTPRKPTARFSDSCAEICCAFNTSSEAERARTGRGYFQPSHVSQGAHILQLLCGELPGHLVAHGQF